MNLRPDSRVLIQGFYDPFSSIYAARMKAYGTNVVAGVNPGQGGLTLSDISVFDSVDQALLAVGPVDTTILFVPPYKALDAALEAIAAGIRQIVILAGMPPLDMVQLLRKAEVTETLILGPNTPGIIVPGKILLGTHASEFYTPGPVGIVSRSSTLTYEIARSLTQAGLGQSVGVSIGSDGITGSSFLQWLQILDEDETTQVIVLIGQPGGNSEEAAARYIAEAIDKPVVAYIAGLHAPVGKHWGHAGTLAAIVGRGVDFGTAQGKIAAFEAATVPVAALPAQIPDLVRKALKKCESAFLNAAN